MGGKSTETSKINQTQTAAPPSWALPQMQSIASGIMAGLGTINGIPAYAGDFVAQPGIYSNQVPQAYADAAAMARSLVPQAQNALTASQQMPTFDYGMPNLQPYLTGFGSSNPAGFDAAVTAATKPVMQQLTEQILPSLQSSAIESGAYGGTRAMYALPEAAIRDANMNMQDIAAQLAYKDFTDTAARNVQAYGLSTDRGLGTANVLTDRLQLTPDLLDSIMRMSGGSAELLAQAGAADQANQQAVLDNALQKYQYSIQQPFMGYDIATDLITRLAGNYGTTNTTGDQTTTKSTGGLAPILGGVLGATMGLASLPMGGAGGTIGGSLVSQLFGKK